MEKRLAMVVVLLAVAVVASSTAWALAPMGTPTAGLKQGQFKIGADYAWARTGVKIEGHGTHLKTNAFLANLGYGIMDDWEGYLRLGAGNVRVEDLSGDYKAALGFGTKYTFLKQDNLDWGALFQMTWLRSEDDELEAKPYDAQIAVGPKYKLNDCISIYGGPYLEVVRGKVETPADDLNIKRTLVGLYGGAEATISENVSAYAELQVAGHSSWGFGTGLAWKF